MQYQIDEKGRLIVTPITDDDDRLIIATLAALSAAEAVLFPVNCKAVGCTQASNDGLSSPPQEKPEAQTQSAEENVQTVRLYPTQARILALLKTINDEIERDVKTCVPSKNSDDWIRSYREDYNALASLFERGKYVEWIMRIREEPQSEDSLEEASKSSS